MIAVAFFSDGVIRRVISVPDYPSILANTGPGETAYEIPENAAYSFPIDIAKVRSFYHSRIDGAAGEERSKYITDVPGQAQTYQRKEDEARRWVEGDDAAHPELYPFMIAEAGMRAVPIVQVRDEIMAQVNALAPLAALIEAKRICAKRAVDAAEDIPGIAGAADVDWSPSLSGDA
ncbi:hypothetical protein FIM10_02195 [Sphingomonadales bacterium 56]|uniref:hypothetical protein n=1 Tax=Sphingobium sp. S6 TaxID=2758386 RepID=UPI00191951AB|nr:hypothetical protein [Sphingobium sp. S6]MBY2927492.1 hypothetical protein [Sphingomonadales bacterium 56]CAD7335334.1 hypothetical protein SPHS6_00446 [Sphingobium sp. S6]